MPRLLFFIIFINLIDIFKILQYNILYKEIKNLNIGKTKL